MEDFTLLLDGIKKYAALEDEDAKKRLKAQLLTVFSRCIGKEKKKSKKN